MASKTARKGFDLVAVREHYYNSCKRSNALLIREPRPKEAYRMVLPPPNVTGNLHIGHAVTVTVEDSFCRYQKSLGKDVTWFPGFDHAGIATQSVVEKQLFKETGKLRKDISDLEFLALCEKWKAKRIEDITVQLNSMGCDLDWPKIFYTMDEKFSKAVTAAFCQLYRDGLIFRDERVVNWCPILMSTVSDQEVEELKNGKKICSRSGGEIELIKKEQWFLKCTDLHDQVMDGLKNGEISIKPESVESGLIEWLKYTQPWCLSRQLLWGHRVPAFMNTELNKWIVANSELEARKLIKSTNALSDVILKQDCDVLDTWFSSSLIPLVVAGWPDKRVDGVVLNVMETGHDIIGFWVARMLAVCKRLTGYFPFTNVVTHGLVRDSLNRKMSKSLGNVVDPMDVINGITLEGMISRLKSSNLPANEIVKAQADLKQKFPNGTRAYGADALRFALLRHDLTGYDVRIDVATLAEEGYKFCNKLWNLCKYSETVFNATENLKECEDFSQLDAYFDNDSDRLILEKLESATQRYTKFMENYEPHMAFDAIFKFILIDLCDTYLESTKQSLWKKDQERLTEISAVLKVTVTKSLKMMRTFMPFVSSYLLDNSSSLLKSDQNVVSLNVNKEIKA